MKKDTTGSKGKSPQQQSYCQRSQLPPRENHQELIVNGNMIGGGGMTPKERASARNKEKGAALKAKKAELIKGFTDTHGRAPKGAERTRLLGLAHKAAKSGS